MHPSAGERRALGLTWRELSVKLAVCGPPERPKRDLHDQRTIGRGVTNKNPLNTDTQDKQDRNGLRLEHLQQDVQDKQDKNNVYPVDPVHPCCSAVRRLPCAVPPASPEHLVRALV